MPNIQKLKLAFRTVRYMTARQWVYRVFYFLKGKLPAAAVRLPRCTDAVPIGGCFEIAQRVDLSLADGLLRQEFPTVAGETVRFEGDIDWDLTGEGYRLKAFNLNSFSWLQCLSDAYRQTGNPAYRDQGLALIRQWQLCCGKRVRGDKWNAYVLAKRLMNQIGFLSTCAGENLPEFVPFLAAQGRILSKNVEFHLGANHVLSEARALMFCGAFLRDEKLYRQGKRILLSEFPVQFLPDGAHYERSVSYHTESMQQYFEALWLMYRRGDEDAPELAQMLRKPYRFLNAMLRCDGTIPLVNDAAWDYPFDAADFLHTASYLYDTPAPNAKAGPYSLRWAMERRGLPMDWAADALFDSVGFLADHFTQDGVRHSLFLHCGDHGPDCNLGHAHADSLSLLWTTEAGEIFADSGVFTYAPGSQRDACRATAAHNTVEVDGVNSCEVWAAFRVARRGHTVIEHFVHDEEKLLVTASHDGYRKMLSDPVTHRRTLHRCKKTGLVTLTDVLISKEGTHSGVLRFHLAPGCSALSVGPQSVLLMGKYLFSCDRPITLESCFVAGNFGIAQPSLCITARFPIRGKTRVTSTVATEAIT